MNYPDLLYIAVGGALGAVARYLLSTWIYSRVEQIYPFGTFAVNMLGCFLLGLIFKLILEKSIMSSELRLMITVGIIGAFTAFSTFSLETLTLFRENNITTALLYVGASIVVGLLAVWLGVVTANVSMRLTMGG